MNKEEILKKLELKRNEIDFLCNCWELNICSKCGEDLLCSTYVGSSYKDQFKYCKNNHYLHIHNNEIITVEEFSYGEPNVQLWNENCICAEKEEE